MTTPSPLALIAELTHRCPLRCVYCSNPTELKSRDAELTTQEWLRVFGEAAALGMMHVHLTGGEPLARTDIVELISGAQQAGLYTNLITSGIPMPDGRLGVIETYCEILHPGKVVELSDRPAARRTRS